MVKNPPASAGDVRRKRCGFGPWLGKIPWRRARQPTPVFLPREPHAQRSLAGCSPQGRTVGQDWRGWAEHAHTAGVGTQRGCPLAVQVWEALNAAGYRGKTLPKFLGHSLPWSIHFKILGYQQQSLKSQGCLKINSEKETEAKALYLWMRVGRPVTQDTAKISCLEKNLPHWWGTGNPGGLRILHPSQAGSADPGGGAGA